MSYKFQNEIKDDNTQEKTEEINISTIVINNFDKSINSKEDIKKIKTLCFSGGGIKGLAFIGALEKLIEKNIIASC